MEIKLKRVPFDIELAKKITEGKIKGAKIITKHDRNARIVCFDKEGVHNIVALVQNKEKTSEDVAAYTKSGLYLNGVESSLDLCLYVPVNYNDYLNFEPQKWQPCLVRDSSLSLWIIRVATGENNKLNGKPTFFTDEGNTQKTFMQVLPISKLTIQLIASTKSYEQLLEEQWTNEE